MFKLSKNSLVVVLIVALAALAVGCGSRGDATGEEESEGSRGGDKAASTELTPGTLGDLKNVCGKGDASGKSARGVSDSTITLSTMADPGGPFVPGLNKQFFESGDAFVKWCNAAGGINGRKLKLTKRDAKMFATAQQTIEACETDFMIVGGGTVIDEPGVKPRVKCNLGMIPAFEISPEAIEAPLQVAPTVANTDLQLAGAFRLLAEKYPEAIKRFGTGGPDVPALISEVDKNVAAAESKGFVLVDQQQAPSQVDDWRPYVQRSQKADVKMLSPTAPGLFLQPYVQAMNDIGYEPDAMTLLPQYYVPQTAEAAKTTKFPPTWVGITAWPLELADENPATQQAISMVKDVLPDAKLNIGHLQSINAWLLWAKSATECGDDLTVDCVLDKAGAETDWTAGGLYAPVNTDPKAKRPSECITMLKVTPEGFSYDKEMTQPNDRVFNCDPANVVRVDVK